MLRLLTLATFILLLASAAWCTDGLVVDTNGKPVANAKVYLYRADDRAPDPKPLFTDAGGKFTHPTPAAGKWCWLAVAQGHSYGYAGRGAKNAADLKLVLWPEKKITGRVVDEKGRPVSGARVWPRYHYAGSDTGADKTPALDVTFPETPFAGVATTGRDGRFTLLHMADRAKVEYFYLRLGEIAPGRALIHREFSRSDLDRAIRIIDPPSCSVTGTVYLPGKSVTAPEGLEVAVDFLMPGEGPRTRSTVLDKNGRFVVRDLPPGHVQLAVAPKLTESSKDGKETPAEPRPWVLPAIKDLELSPQQMPNLKLEMVAGNLVRGRVVENGTGNIPSSGRVLVEHAGAMDGIPQTVLLDGNGEFSARVMPGHVKISLLSLQVGKKSAWWSDFEDQPPPSVEFDVAGEAEKTGIVLSATIKNQGLANDSSGADKPAPPDFELKPGVYHLTWDAELGANWSQGSLSGSKARAMIAKAPPLTSSKPQFVAVRLDRPDADGMLLAIFDESKGTGTGYDTTYVDLNRNRDLTDDRPIRWRGGSPNEAACFWVTVPARQGAGADQADNQLSFRWQASRGGGHGFICVKGGWRGTLDSNKGPVEVVLRDSNNNGLFSDPFRCGNASTLSGRGMDQGDCVFVDVNGCGRAVTTKHWGPHTLVQGGANILGGKVFALTASASGDTITVARSEAKMGTLLLRGLDINGLDGRADLLNVLSTQRLFSRYDLDGQAITLPAGRYRVFDCVLLLRNGKEKLRVYGALDKIVAIEPNKQTTITVTGKPRLTLMPGVPDVVFKPGSRQELKWEITVGDSLKRVVLTTGDGAVAIPKARFDGEGDFVGLQELIGGG